MGLSFVGRDAERAVGALEDAWRRCVAEQVSQLVLIEGHPGVGKTRLVQEFYERLQANQPSPAYWPPLLSSEHDGALHDRGRLRPLAFSCPPGAKPPFAWVPISCRLDEVTGLPSRALIDAVGASERMMDRVISPIGRSRRLTGQLLRAALVIAGLIAAVLGLLDQGGLLVVVVGVVTAFTGIAFEAREQLEGAAHELRHRRQERTKDDVMVDVAVPLEDVSLDAHARASAFLTALGRRGIPGIVVVDDAQWADPDTVKLVDALLERATATLVVATVRPTPFHRQLAERTAMGQVAHDYAAKTEHHVLEPLATEELIGAVLHLAPATPEPVARAIAEHAAGNPLVLGATLDQPVLRRSLSGGAFHLRAPERELANLPSDPRGVFEAYWEQLPEDVQQLVALAGMQGTVVEGRCLAASFAAAVGGDHRGPRDQALHEHGWLVELDDHLDRFADPALHDVGRRQTHSVLSERELLEATQAMVRVLTDLRQHHPAQWTAIDEAGRRAVLRVHIDAARGGLVDSDAAAATSALELAELTNGPSEAASSLALASTALDWNEEPEVEAACRELSAHRLIELGRFEEALEHLESVQRLGTVSDQRRSFECRRMTGEVLTDLGRPSIALDLLGDLEVDVARALGPRAKLTLSCRLATARALTAAGQTTSAIAALENVVDDTRVVFGADDHNTVAARTELARTLRGVGRAEESILILEAIANRQLETLGADHPDTVRSRSELALSQWRAGRHTDALATHQDLLQLRIRVLGPEHPKTLRTKMSIANTLHSLERFDEALELASTVLDDRTRLLGPGHPDTLRARNDVATKLVDTGQLEQALDRLTELQQLQTEHLAEDNVDRLTTALNIVHLHLELSNYDLAMAQVLELEARAPALLGAEHRLTGQVALQKVLVEHQMGDLEVALSDIDALIAHQQRHQGAQAADTLRSHEERVALLVDLGRHAEAIDAIEELTPHLIATFGPDHIRTHKLEATYESLLSIRPSRE